MITHDQTLYFVLFTSLIIAFRCSLLRNFLLSAEGTNKNAGRQHNGANSNTWRRVANQVCVR